MKYVLVIAVVGAVLWLMLGRGRKLPRRPSARASAPPPQQEMVRCAHCGVHLPRSEAILSSGQLFCSDAHRIAGAGPADRP